MPLEATDESIVATIFVGSGEDEGCVGMVLRGTPLCLFEGKLMPGVAMQPEDARKLANELIEFAEFVEHPVGQENT